MKRLLLLILALLPLLSRGQTFDVQVLTAPPVGIEVPPPLPADLTPLGGPVYIVSGGAGGVAINPDTLVRTTRTYTDPAWLTGLAFAKITGLPVSFPSTIALVTGLQTALDSKAPSSDVYTKAQSDARYLQGFSESDPLFGANFAAAIAAYDTRAVNDTRYRPIGYVPSWNDVTGKPSTFAPSAHTHDERYFTETESDARYLQSFTETDPVAALHAARTDNPHGTTAAQVGAYTSGQTDALLTPKLRHLALASEFATATEARVQFDGSTWERRTGTAPTVGLNGVFRAGPAGTYYERQLSGQPVTPEMFGAAAVDSFFVKYSATNVVESYWLNAALTVPAPNQTTAIQNALDYAKASGRWLRFRRGYYFADSLGIPDGTNVQGVAIGDFGKRPSNDGTVLVQRPGANGDFITFKTTDALGLPRVTSIVLKYLILLGNNANATGNGISFRKYGANRTLASSHATLNGTHDIAHLFIREFPEDGVFIRRGGVPLHLSHINTQLNGGYGVSVWGEGGLTNAVFNQIDGDANKGGAALYIRSVADANVVITGLTGEYKQNVWYGATPGFTYAQPYPLELGDFGPRSRVLINGAFSRAYNVANENADAAIKVSAASAGQTPFIQFSSVGCYNQGGLNNSNRSSLFDSRTGTRIPMEVPSGVYDLNGIGVGFAGVGEVTVGGNGFAPQYITEGGMLWSRGNNPYIGVWEDDGATNRKGLVIGRSGNNIQFRTVNDAFSPSTFWNVVTGSNGFPFTSEFSLGGTGGYFRLTNTNGGLLDLRHSSAGTDLKNWRLKSASGVASFLRVTDAETESTEAWRATAAGGFLQTMNSKAGAPTTSDVPAGMGGLWKNTSDGTLREYINDGGSILTSPPLNASGTVAVANGGTGATTASGARTNLGLGGAATLNVGTTAGTVAAGDDSRFSDTRTPTDGTVTTAKVVDGAVTYAKIQNVTSGRMLGRTTAGAGVIEELSAAAVRAFLAIAFTDVSGTLQAGQFPALTGDVTTTAGSLATTLATVNSNVGTFGSATQVPVITVDAKGRVTAASTVAVSGGGSDPHTVLKQTADITESAGTGSDVTDLNFTATANTTYEFELTADVSASATGVGPQVAVDVPSGTVSLTWLANTTATTMTGYFVNADNTFAGGGGYGGSGAGRPVSLRGRLIIAGTGGTVTTKIRKLGTGNVTLRNAILKYRTL